jgi:hypothetical protein
VGVRDKTGSLDSFSYIVGLSIWDRRTGIQFGLWVHSSSLDLQPDTTSRTHYWKRCSSTPTTQALGTPSAEHQRATFL